jgi:N-acyl-D-amino-acid deacylase
VIGNCGFSPAPSPVDKARAVREAIALIDLDPALTWTWSDFAGYLAALNSARPAINVMPLIGHIALRVADPTISGMTNALEASLQEGAAGVSTGLMYPPAMFAEPNELAALGKVAARHDALFAIHMRDYQDHLVEAVDESLQIARTSGVRLQLSHLAVAGRRNWGLVVEALDHVDRARQQGLDVAVDIYPYLAGFANLSQLLPAWTQAGTRTEMLQRLEDEANRVRILDDWKHCLRFGWDEVEISSIDGPQHLVGQTVAAIAGDGRNVGAVALDLIRQARDRVYIVAYGRSEDDLQSVLTHPCCVLGSDGFAIDPDGPTAAGRPHPRSFGTYPRLLGEYVRHRGWLSLERAVAMATSGPAERLRLKDRGTLRPGACADLVVFDPTSVIDRATYQEPMQFPDGIEHVVVNGTVVVENGTQHDERRPGRVLVR